MNAASRYIMPVGEDVNVTELEDIGYVIYTNPDGITHYAVKEGAPEEAHQLASGAAQGDPDLISQIEESE